MAATRASLAFCGTRGSSAAAPITATNARQRATTSSASEPSGSPKTRTPPVMADSVALAEKATITAMGSPSCSPRARARKPPIPPTMAIAVQGLITLSGEEGTVTARALIATSETPIDVPAATASRSQPLLTRRRCAEATNSSAGERERPTLEGEHGRMGEGTVLLRVPGGQRQEAEPSRAEPEPDQVPRPHRDPEPAARRDGQQREPAGDHGLDERQGRHRKSHHVQCPAEGGEARTRSPTSASETVPPRCAAGSASRRRARRRRRGACRASPPP